MVCFVLLSMTLIEPSGVTITLWGPLLKVPCGVFLVMSELFVSFRFWEHSLPSLNICRADFMKYKSSCIIRMNTCQKSSSSFLSELLLCCCELWNFFLVFFSDFYIFVVWASSILLFCCASHKNMKDVLWSEHVRHLCSCFLSRSI